MKMDYYLSTTTDATLPLLIGAGNHRTEEHAILYYTPTLLNSTTWTTTWNLLQQLAFILALFFTS